MPLLSIIVPVYNEERTLDSIMRSLSAACPDAEIMYVDDGSQDGSLQILRKLARVQDTVLTKPNGGKGSAIRMGLLHARGTFTTVQDADLEYDPSEINNLHRTAQNEHLDAVFGSRFLRENPNVYRRFLWGNKVMTLLINLLFSVRLTDSYTCYKLLRTDLFRSLNLTSNGFEMETEICAKLGKRGIPIKEIPISYRPRTIEEGKKIGWKDAWRGMRMMLQIKFSNREMVSGIDEKLVEQEVPAHH